MSRPELLTFVMVGFAVIIALGAIGWTTRRRRQRDIPAPAAVPDDVGGLIAEFEGFYVSTTLDGQPLNRVAVRGLGFRARATIAVTGAGIVLALPGHDVFIPRADIREISRAQYTIDRVVEPGGLVLVAWTLGETRVDSYLRVAETDQLVDALLSIAAPAASSTSPLESGDTQ
jgi:hypothetical protein